MTFAEECGMTFQGSCSNASVWFFHAVLTNAVIAAFAVYVNVVTDVSVRKL